jgi:hypothetical protein
MDTKLSELAVANLRFRLKGFPLRERDLPAYRELVAAGIMEAASGTEYRFTPWGLEHGAEILERESERIERQGAAPPHRLRSRGCRRREPARLPRVGGGQGRDFRQQFRRWSRVGLSTHLLGMEAEGRTHRPREGNGLIECLGPAAQWRDETPIRNLSSHRS